MQFYYNSIVIQFKTDNRDRIAIQRVPLITHNYTMRVQRLESTQKLKLRTLRKTVLATVGPGRGGWENGVRGMGGVPWPAGPPREKNNDLARLTPLLTLTIVLTKY